jgi:hypothetical protein
MFRNWVFEHGYPRGLRLGRCYRFLRKDRNGYSTQDTLVVKECRGDVLCNPYLPGSPCGIPYGKMVYAGGLVGLLPGLEGGCCRPIPSHEWEGGDVVGLGGGAVPVTLKVSSQDKKLMRERLR